MNRIFISIKVDREERPDIDGIYMAVCQALTGHGGWPLTIVMTPEKKPFYAATYIPKQSRYGRPGMLDLIPQIQGLWKNQRGQVLEAADHIVSALRQSTPGVNGAADLTDATLHNAYQQLKERFDERYGGFGTSPKFPTPHNLLFLLRYWKRTGNEQALRMVAHTLHKMRSGGIFDHIGFGFHRYATDAEWIAPHFEKMLYDQALLAMAYVEAFQATGHPAFEKTAREIFEYVLRDMTAPEGGFYSAEDADSEGREGKFYLWTPDELRNALGKEAANPVMRRFNVQEGGNFEEESTRQKTGENILHLAESGPASADQLSYSEVNQEWEKARRQLFLHREQRVHPFKDDKILTDWNGLMIAALSKGSIALKDTRLAQTARRAADFISHTMQAPDGSLWHRYRNGEAGIHAHLDDYVFMTWGLLELYEATFDVSLLQKALQLNHYLLQHFWDENNYGFFFTSDSSEALIIRQKDLYDGAVPSGNSIAILNLLRLARITGNPALEQKAADALSFAASQVNRYPSAHTALLMGLDFALGPAFEIVLSGSEDDPGMRAMLEAVREPYMPRKVLLLRTDDAAQALANVAPYVTEQTSIEGKATAYICRNYYCERPVTDPEDVRKRLRVV